MLCRRRFLIADTGRLDTNERYAVTRNYSKELLRSVEQAAGVPIEVLFVIASMCLSKRKRMIDTVRADSFGGNVASLALREYGSNDPVWDQEWLVGLVPVRSL